MQITEDNAGTVRAAKGRAHTMEMTPEVGAEAYNASQVYIPPLVVRVDCMAYEVIAQLGDAGLD